MFPHINPTHTTAYNELKSHYQTSGVGMKMTTMFEKDAERFASFSVQHKGLLFDYSKNLIDATTQRLLIKLAEECGLVEAMKAFLAGEKINATEQRPVMHMALRSFGKLNIDQSFTSVVKPVLAKIKQFVTDIHQGKSLGYTGKKIRYIVNIGIGGSDLGPAMVSEALQAYKHSGMEAFFVSNVDGSHLDSVLKKIDVEETLFLIASKTFTTQETMANAHQARNFVLQHYQGKAEAIASHFVAISTNHQEVTKFGISSSSTFEFWDWVGGRFSLWSSIGLSIALFIGYDHFEALLRGAEDIDQHFFETPLEKNIPVLMAMLSVWYGSFFNVQSEAILPYAQYLHRFPAYLQQAIMESNGKYIDRTGKPVSYPTSPVVWGEPGTNGQHAFYQLLHQGTFLIPIDFIGFARLPQPYNDQHDILTANLLAQAQALMVGKDLDSVKAEMQQAGKSEADINKVAPYRVFTGNRPSNMLFFEELTPFSLGQLIALYEHKIFTQGVIWNIYSFDQWGVELGKHLANQVLASIHSQNADQQKDASTRGLLHYFLKNKKG